MPLSIFTQGKCISALSIHRERSFSTEIMTALLIILLLRLDLFFRTVVIGVECVFTWWYWIADFCEDHNIPFVLGHALYMKAIHGGKTKNDKIDSSKIASLIRGRLFPNAYVYLRNMRATRDLLRRRQYFTHKQSELLGHIKNTASQYNLPAFQKSIQYGSNRTFIPDYFQGQDPSVQLSIKTYLENLDFYHKELNKIELQITRNAVHHDPYSYQLLKTVPGIGPILGLVILYAIAQKIGRSVYYILKRKEPFDGIKCYG